jgi:hypothetical protein
MKGSHSAAVRNRSVVVSKPASAFSLFGMSLFAIDLVIWALAFARFHH